MFHWSDVVINNRGDALPNWQVECVDYTDGSTVIPIFSDENSTPILTVSGVTNRALADENGNYDFFVPNGTYSLRFYNAQGVFQRLRRYITMYGAQTPATVETVTGTSYTLIAADNNKVKLFTNSGAITVTLPADADAAYPIGAATEFHQEGAGVITFVAGSGATLVSLNDLASTAGRYAVVGIRKKAANTFKLAGALG